jgi:hypothetical protein
MTRRKIAETNAPGQDSFLDIVANLVGILIILVLVIGVRAKDAMLEASPLTQDTETPVAAPPPSELPDVAAASQAAEAVQTDIHDIDEKIRDQQFNIEFRRAERDRVQLLVQAAEATLENERAKLDHEAQQQFDLQRRIVESRAELDEVSDQVASLKATEAPVTVLTHLPTPMAKTVFGREIHFRLQGGRLAFVPWDRLVEMLKEDAPSKVWRLKHQDAITETLGPIGGFWLKYRLRRKQHALQTRIGVAIQQGVELDHFVVMPISEEIGEPLEEALRGGSQLLTILEAQRPAGTTITVWTYPDSFEEFRELKAFLFERGFLTASRPLPAGFPIGGSPQGQRSSAQ